MESVGTLSSTAAHTAVGSFPLWSKVGKVMQHGSHGLRALIRFPPVFLHHVRRRPLPCQTCFDDISLTRGCVPVNRYLTPVRSAQVKANNLPNLKRAGVGQLQRKNNKPPNLQLQRRLRVYVPLYVSVSFPGSVCVPAFTLFPFLASASGSPARMWRRCLQTVARAI